MMGKKHRFSLGAFGIVLMLFPLCSGLLAQGDRGLLSGRVADSSGAVISGASVTLTNEDTKVALRSKSNNSGEFTFTALNPGHYTIEIVRQGFNSYKQNHIQVDVGETAAVNASLAPGNVSEEVTIQANAQQLETTSPNLGMTIEEKSITDLPLVYGNPFALEFLVPGVVLSGVNPNIHVYDSGTSAVSINGSLLNSIDYKLDGATDNWIRVSAFTPNQESIAQYRMNTANYDSTGGHASGGFVNLATKSGTDRFHGSIFGYYQNTAINANQWLLNPAVVPQTKPEFQRYGASIGGPILRQKLFFFASAEHSVQGNPTSGTQPVPTMAERGGDFSALLALDGQMNKDGTPALTCGTAPAPLSPVGTGSNQTVWVNQYQLFDPFTAIAFGNNVQRNCLPGNIVPATAISPVAKALFALYPAPNGGTSAIGSYSYSVLNHDQYLGGIARLDYTIDQRQSMFAHILRSSRANLAPTYFGLLNATHLDYENYGAALGHTLVLSSSTVINSSLSWARWTNKNKNGAQGVATPTTLGMSANLVNGLPVDAQALPRITPTGYTALNSTSAVQTEEDTYLANVTASKQAGAHYFRFGGEYRRYIANGSPGTAENGSYTASGNTNTYGFNQSNSVGGAGFSIAELEYGLIDSGSQTQNADYSTVEHYFAGFLQDDWRATARLTVNMGLRYEYETPIIERNNKMIVAFNPTATNSKTGQLAAAYAANGASKLSVASPATNLWPATVNPTGGVAYANTLGYGRAGYTSPTHDFSPRVGFAFAANPKTVLRGGFALLFDSIESYLISGTNNGSIPIIPQVGYSQVSNVTPPVASVSSLGVATVTYSSFLADPFPSGLTPLTGPSSGYDTGIGQNVQFLQPNPHTPYNERFSLGVQRQIAQFILSVDYVGNHGVHLFTYNLQQGTNLGGTEFNAIPRQLLSTYTDGLDEVAQYNFNYNSVPNPWSNLVPKNSANGLSGTTIGPAQFLRPYPEFGSVNAYTTNGMSIYHALQAQLQRRFTNGLSLTSAFTWSRLMDASYYLNPSDTVPWYGVSANDRPLRYSGSYIYQLPWGHGRRWLNHSHGLVAQIVGGWQTQGIFQVQSGAPITFSNANLIYRGGNPGNSHWSRAAYKKTQYTAPLTASGSGGPVGGLWFNPANWMTSSINGNPLGNYQTTIGATSVITNPAVIRANNCGNPNNNPNGTPPNLNYIGNTPRCSTYYPGSYQIHTFPLRFNNLRADHLEQMDVGIQRQFQVLKLGTLQFRAEAINVFNHPVYSAPQSTDPTNFQFGLITSQGNAPRLFQFAGFFRF